MSNKKITFAIFVLIALIQVYVPAKMIFNSEMVLVDGTPYKFKTAPIDPYDPFRGKYITLDFANNSIAIPEEEEWTEGETVYVIPTIDDEGFAIIQSVSKHSPTSTSAFFKANVQYVMPGVNSELIIDFPFERYYMEESKAMDAELAYRDVQRSDDQIAYALVYIKNGEAVLKDVLINDISIKDWVQENAE